MVRKIKTRKFHKEYYILTGIITSIVFILGVLSGLLIENGKVFYLEKQFSELEIAKLDGEIQDTLVQNLHVDKCKVFRYQIEKLIPQVSKFGERLEFYEATKRINNEQYEYLKKKYTLLNIKYWFFVKKAKEECNYTYVPILYFYSNKNCKNCDVQGYVLSNLKRINPKKYMIFAIDGDINLETVKLLKKVYNVTSYPTLIINEHTYNKFLPMNKILELTGWK